jgi:hypothetical protein
MLNSITRKLSAMHRIENILCIVDCKVCTAVTPSVVTEEETAKDNM